MLRLIAVVATASAIVVANVGAQAPDVGRIIAAARGALGGEARLASVKTLVASGRILQLRGGVLASVELEISCALPDKCVRTEEVPAQESGVTRNGFNGDSLIQSPPQSLRPGLTESQRNVIQRPRVLALKHDMARLMLGMMAASPSYPLTFKYAGRAEAPQGQADVIAATAPGDLALLWFIYRDSHLPVMVSWRVPATGPDGVEHRLYFADYRRVDGGLVVPFRLRRAIGQDPVEETTFDQVRIDGPVDARTFEVTP